MSHTAVAQPCSSLARTDISPVNIPPVNVVLTSLWYLYPAPLRPPHLGSTCSSLVSDTSKVTTLLIRI